MVKLFVNRDVGGVKDDVGISGIGVVFDGKFLVGGYM